MNRSKKFSKWPVFALSLLLLGSGAATLRAQGGWFSPISQAASMEEIAAVHTLQYVDEGDGTDSGAIQQTSYRQAPRRMPTRRPAPRRPMRMAMNGDDDLSWSFDEGADFSVAEIEPKIQEEAEVLPSEAIRVRPKEQTAGGAMRAVPVSESDSPETGWEGDSRKEFKDLVPSFDPDQQPLPVPTTRGNSPEPISDAHTANQAKLPQAQTQIDRFGNIGHLENYYAARTEDGGLSGNPYADGVYDFHPMYFPWDPARQTHTRMFPPAESYGVNNCGGCYDPYCGYRYGCCRGLLRNTELSAGVYSYQDPIGFSNNADFGVDLGVNWTLPRRILGLTWQAGARYLRSGKDKLDLNLAAYDLDFVPDDLKTDFHRTQFFWTSGLFYSCPGNPWKFGVVYDSVQDKTVQKYNVSQLRTELSRTFCNSDIGFRGAFHLKEEKFRYTADDFEYEAKVSAQTYYTGFIRHRFVTGAEGTISAGATEDSEALIGGRIEVPVTNHSCIRNNFVYVFPKDKKEDNSLGDTWSASISWVVYLGGSSHGGLANPMKPLFDVADNTSLLQRVRIREDF
ncbi:MAG: hypothetical protein J6S40_05545 [Thermoguttaceae bacterium]|nr:hypothetical protein [Thermoguttaceae bacterium]